MGLNTVEIGDGKVGVITASISLSVCQGSLPRGYVLPEARPDLSPAHGSDPFDFAGKVEKLYVIEELDPFHGGCRSSAAGIACASARSLTGKHVRAEHRSWCSERVLRHQDPLQDHRRRCRRCEASPGAVSRAARTAASSIRSPRTRDYRRSPAISAATRWGSAAPLNCMDVCICMGGGFTASASVWPTPSSDGQNVTDKVVFGVMGDSTFFHSGMTGAAEIIYNNARMIPCVLDNRITGMTGHQENPGSGFTLHGRRGSHALNIEKIFADLRLRPRAAPSIPRILTAMKKTVDEAVAALNEGKHRRHRHPPSRACSSSASSTNLGHVQGQCRQVQRAARAA